MSCFFLGCLTGFFLFSKKTADDFDTVVEIAEMDVVGTVEVDAVEEGSWSSVSHLQNLFVSQSMLPHHRQCNDESVKL